jgi:transcriptional regulator with XRE-family HTH domain
MLEHQHRFRLQRMAAVFGVSRSGYYQWRRTGQEPGEKTQRRAAGGQLTSTLEHPVFALKIELPADRSLAGDL